MPAGQRLFAPRSGCRGGGAGRLFRRHAVELSFDVKNGTGAGLAFHRDRAAHQVQRFFDDGQAEAGPARFGIIAAVLLAEWFEEHLLERFAHADACVADTGIHREPAAVREVFAQAVGYGAALRREFDRVGEQVEEDLVDAQRVQKRQKA